MESCHELFEPHTKKIIHITVQLSLFVSTFLDSAVSFRGGNVRPSLVNNSPTGVCLSRPTERQTGLFLGTIDAYPFLLTEVPPIHYDFLSVGGRTHQAETVSMYNRV